MAQLVHLNQQDTVVVEVCRYLVEVRILPHQRIRGQALVTLALSSNNQVGSRIVMYTTTLLVACIRLIVLIAVMKRRRMAPKRRMDSCQMQWLYQRMMETFQSKKAVAMERRMAISQ